MVGAKGLLERFKSISFHRRDKSGLVCLVIVVVVMYIMKNSLRGYLRGEVGAFSIINGRLVLLWCKVMLFSLMVVLIFDRTSLDHRYYFGNVQNVRVVEEQGVLKIANDRDLTKIRFESELILETEKTSDRVFVVDEVSGKSQTEERPPSLVAKDSALTEHREPLPFKSEEEPKHTEGVGYYEHTSYDVSGNGTCGIYRDPNAMYRQDADNTTLNYPNLTFKNTGNPYYTPKTDFQCILNTSTTILNPKPSTSFPLIGKTRLLTYARNIKGKKCIEDHSQEALEMGFKSVSMYCKGNLPKEFYDHFYPALSMKRGGGLLGMEGLHHFSNVDGNERWRAVDLFGML